MPPKRAHKDAQDPQSYPPARSSSRLRAKSGSRLRRPFVAFAEPPSTAQHPTRNGRGSQGRARGRSIEAAERGLDNDFEDQSDRETATLDSQTFDRAELRRIADNTKLWLMQNWLKVGLGAFLSIALFCFTPGFLSRQLPLAAVMALACTTKGLPKIVRDGAWLALLLIVCLGCFAWMLHDPSEPLVDDMGGADRVFKDVDAAKRHWNGADFK